MECVLKEWARSPTPFDRITLFTPAPLEQERLAFPLEAFDVRVLGPHGPDPFWEWRALSPRAPDVDVLFCPSYTIPLGYRGKCVVTNLGPSENAPLGREWWRARAYERLYRYSARRATQVCACSRSVKRRLIDRYGIPEEKIHVTYLAASDAFTVVTDPALLDAARARWAGGRSPLILFVGKLTGRHHIPRLLQAFAQARRTAGLPHTLLLVGPDPLGLDVAGRAARLGLGDAVLHVPYVGHRDLPALYSAAEIFVFPATEAEGFGIPVVEAMACGTPVVTVNQGSLREFAPGAAHVVEAPSVADLRDGILAVASDPSLRARLRESGIARAASITWAHTARKTMDILWRVASS